jgi:predicted metal-dependent hydrolase
VDSAQAKNAGTTVLKRFFTKSKPAVLPFDYQIRRSQRAKKTRIVVKHDKIEIVSPPQIPEHKLHEFIHKQQAWVLQALTTVEQRRQTITSLAPDAYCHGVKVPYRGEVFLLTIKSSLSQKVSLSFDENTGFLLQGPYTQKLEHNEGIRLTLIDWMMKQAGLEATSYINKHASRYQLQPRSLRIKEQKSRWGSCGVRDDINLNWLLILAPPSVLEYVVVHELCHLRHRNHSAAFWDLVAEHMPDYQQHRKWLKQHGQRLMQGI